MPTGKKRINITVGDDVYEALDIWLRSVTSPLPAWP